MEALAEVILYLAARLLLGRYGDDRDSLFIVALVLLGTVFCVGIVLFGMLFAIV